MALTLLHRRPRHDLHPHDGWDPPKEMRGDPAVRRYVTQSRRRGGKEVPERGFPLRIRALPVDRPAPMHRDLGQG